MKIGKKWKQKLFRCTKGAISILLCLVMAPFLTISLSLVEYARYQQVFEMVDELEELTGISLLNDYDKYIHNRFGLFAVSQQQNLNSTANEYMKANLGSLGSQVKLNSTTVNGVFSLADTDVIQGQIVDVAELTGLAQVLMEDFNLEEVFARLEKLKQMSDMLNMVDGIATLTENISSAITTMQTLKDTIQNMQNAVINIKSSGETLSTQVRDFYTKLMAEGWAIPETLEGEEWNDILLSATGYEEELKNIYGTAKSMITNAETIKSGAESIPGLVETLKGNIKACSEAAKNIKSGNSSDSGAIEAEASTSLESVVQDMEDLVTDTLNNIKDSALNTAKDAANQIINRVFEETGLANAYNRYSAIANGTYFESDVGKQDLKELIALIPEVYNSASPDAMLQAIKSKLVPSIDLDLSDILTDINGVLENAVKNIKSNSDKGFFAMLTGLAETLEGLFKLECFYDPELNACLANNPASGDRSTENYEKFLTSITGMSGKIDEIGKLVENVSLANVIEVIKKLGEFFDYFWDFLESLGKIIVNTLGDMVKLITGGVDAAYERLLIAGYAAHNFPNRTSVERVTEHNYNGVASTKRVALKGTGLTGFDYNQIARPYQYMCETKGKDATSAMKNSAGKDNMFKGAMMEYVVCPTSSEIANQTMVFLQLYFLRLLCNLTAVFMDGEVASLAASANVACWVVYILYALIEPFCDTILLVNGGSVPLIKFDCFMTTSGLDNFISQLKSVTMDKAVSNSIDSIESMLRDSKPEISGTKKPDKSSGVPSLTDDMLSTNYQTHLLLMAIIGADNKTLTNRIKGLVKIEATEYYKQKNVSFEWSKTYTAIAVTANIDFNTFFDVGALNGSGSIKINSKRVQPVGY